MTQKLALVTGGHRRLGGAISAALARAGYALAIHGSHDTAPDAYLAAALNETTVDWQGFVTDFSDSDAVQSLFNEVTTHFGQAPDLLVNNAAIFGQDTLSSVTPGDLQAHFGVNCGAAVIITRAFAASGPVSGRDRSVVNILDQRLVHPHGDQLAYTLSKQALAGFTQIAARTLAPLVRVNAVAPGLTIATQDYTTDQMARLADMMPLGRLPMPAQIAEAVLYLAQAQAVTGQVLHVDGGAHMESYARDFMHL